MSAARAVVFGYHDVGVRCLEALISGGVGVPLVVTVADDPHEAQWFGSVAATAAEYGIEATLRDTVPATIFSGTSDIQRMIIVKELGL